MAASMMGLQAKASVCLTAAYGSIVAGSRGKGVVASKQDSIVGDSVVRVVPRSVVAQRSVAVDCGGGRGSPLWVNSKAGFGGYSGGLLRGGRTEEQSEITADQQRRIGGRLRAAVAPQADFEARPEPKVTYVALELIGSEGEFDRVLRQAQERNEPIVIDWMASWCRKCLYLKPKLEKLAALYHPNLRFYYVDVNNVPQSMVKRAEVTQMPTIQLWRNGAHEAEVIGGHQAQTVVDLVKDMITKGMLKV